MAIYMPKKCIPGVICIENTTIFVIVLIILFGMFLWYQRYHLAGKNENVTNTTNNYSALLYPPKHSQHPMIQQHLATIPSQDIRGDVGRCTMGGGTVGDPLTNAYVPPIKCDAGGLMNVPLTMNVPSNGIPINVPTQHYNTQYSQMGILTKRYGSNNEILPIILDNFYAFNFKVI